ncbi:MAG TPA: hypothetical protein DCQ06_03480 [Myxococcales bacterium]|nr:hypothetical protein [Myxococcales bacterium]HAN30638.1 hypothetical protein [Myxococcales bacterium]
MRLKDTESGRTLRCTLGLWLVLGGIAACERINPSTSRTHTPPPAIATPVATEQAKSVQAAQDVVISNASDRIIEGVGKLRPAVTRCYRSYAIAMMKATGEVNAISIEVSAVLTQQGRMTQTRVEGLPRGDQEQAFRACLTGVFEALKLGQQSSERTIQKKYNFSASQRRR